METLSKCLKHHLLPKDCSTYVVEELPSLPSKPSALQMKFYLSQVARNCAISGLLHGNGRKVCSVASAKEPAVHFGLAISGTRRLHRPYHVWVQEHLLRPKQHEDDTTAHMPLTAVGGDASVIRVPPNDELLQWYRRLPTVKREVAARALLNGLYIAYLHERSDSDSQSGSASNSVNNNANNNASNSANNSVSNSANNSVGASNIIAFDSAIPAVTPAAVQSILKC